MSNARSMIKRVMQNIGMMRFKKNYKFKNHFSDGILSHVPNNEYNFKNISDLELQRLKFQIQRKGELQRKKILWITIIFSSITFVCIYYFFDIATR